MTLKLPFPAVTENDRKPARKLWIELTTRITTQRLHYRSGDEETAAKSIQSLFATTRVLLAEHGPSAAFDFASVFMLNRVIRPYTARWHRWMVDERFRSELARRQFRKELSALREKLKRFDALFDTLARGLQPGVELLERCFGAITDGAIVFEEESGNGLAEMGEPVEAGIGRQVAIFLGNATPPAAVTSGFVDAGRINEVEREAIRKRRIALERPAPAQGAPIMDATGLCLSGGGIRSATFCLGIVQVLAEKGMLAQFDYLSTVSGGGYFGAFVSSYVGVEHEELKQKLAAPTDPAVNAPQPGGSAAGATTKAGASENPAGKIADVPSKPAEAESKAQPSPVRGPQPNAHRERIKKIFAPRPGGAESRAVRHLRNNSRYLLNGGLWARFRVVGLLLSGVLTNLLVFVQVPLLAVLIVYGLQWCGFWGMEGVFDYPWHHAWPSLPRDTFAGDVLIALGIGLAALWALLALVQNATHRAPPKSFGAGFRTFWITATLLVALAAAAAAALFFLPALVRWYASLREHPASVTSIPITETTLAAITGAGTFILGPLAARVSGAGRGKKLLSLLFAISGPLLLLFIFLFAGSRLLLPDERTWNAAPLAIVTGLLFLWSWVWLNINTHGPHRYYRDRLCECYLALPRKEGEGDHVGTIRAWLRGLLHGRPHAEREVDTLQRLPLSALGSNPAAPYHLINTAVNLPSSRDPNLRGRDSDFFVFSRDFCGGPICGYVPTATIEELDPHFDLGTAMAVSGAAASSNMGAKTMHQFRFLMTLTNIRLGYWLRNPRRLPWPPRLISRILGAPGPGYLFSEMAGWMHERSRYLNLSDGGHIENLALYELLRRRCKYIVVVDAGQEPGMECSDLLLVQRYAAIDLGIEMQFDLTDLMLDDKRTSRAYAVLGKIFYEPEKMERGDLGWLVYIKLAVVGGEPAYVGDYRRQCPDFPHQSTGDQIYEEAQFEAYRALGVAAAESLFDEELTEPFRSARARQRSIQAGAVEIETIEDWFQAMATSLLPDNDPVFPTRT